MAPNLVKSSSALSLDLSSHINFSLEPQLSAVYPPLTDVDVLTYEGDQQNDTIFSAPLKRSNSVIFNIMVKDEAQRAVSCAQIEANLIADSRRIEESSQEYIVNDHQDQEVESYWDMPSDCDNAKQEANIVSTAQVERNLVEDALRRAEAKSDKDVVVNQHPNNAYWDWPSEPVLESEKKASLIASILLEESIRERLSIDSITNNEVSNKSEDRPSSMSSSSPQVEEQSENVSSDYWYWSAQEEAKEEVVAPHVHDPSHPNHAYWDFPSEPTNAEDLRQKIIDNILKEERIRQILSTKATEEREVNYHQQKEGKKEYCSACRSELDSMPENYWDFNASSESGLSLLSNDKQALINRILREEQLRYILSTENIESHLVTSSKKGSPEAVRSNVDSGTVSTSYWDW